MISRLFIPLMLLALVCGNLEAQLEHSVWYFGDMAGVDFRGGAPVALTNGMDYQWEGTATISDGRSGAFVLHTDGDTVWNRNGGVMPNGTGLGGHISSTQSALILPMPGDSTKYIVLSADAGEYYQLGTGGKGVRWAIVDMTLDGGLGAVTSRDNVLVQPAAEKIAAVPNCNGRGYWVVVHELDSDRFLVFDVNERGVGPGRAIPIGTPHRGSPKAAVGGMKFTTDGTKLAVALSHADLVEIFDFDRATGTLSNPLTLSTGEFVYDVCFSPDGTRLYISGDNARYLAQFDLTRGTRAAIEASRVELFRSTDPRISRENIGQIQIGLDDRVYVALKEETELGIVTRPNLVGTAAGYQHRALPLAGRWCLQGLPNFVYRVRDTTLHTCKPPRAQFLPSDTSICAGTSIEFIDLTIDSPTSWRWSFDGGNPSNGTWPTPPTIAYDNPGRFRATLIVENDFGADTFSMEIVVNPIPTVDAGPERTICTGGSAALEITATDAATYEWSPTAGLDCTDCPSPVASPTATTMYSVRVLSEFGCEAVDSVLVVVEPYPAVDAGEDLSICSGDTVQLVGSGGFEYTWTPSEGLSCTDCQSPQASPRRTVTYHLTATNNGRCPSVDSVTVTVRERPVADAGEAPEICIGDTTQLAASGDGVYSWSPSDGLTCVDCSSPMAFPTRTTTYHVLVSNDVGCASVDSVTVRVNPAPRLVHVNLGMDQRVFPGKEVRVPLVLEEPLDSAYVNVFDVAIDYLPTMMVARGASLQGGLVEGWTLIPQIQDSINGRWSARLVAPQGQTLRGSGTILWVTFATFIHFGEGSAATPELFLPDAWCTRIATTPASIYLDSLCGLSERLITLLDSGTALERPRPNPVNTTTEIRMRIANEGPTVLEIFDALGRPVETLMNLWLSPGTYTAEWNARDASAGIYYCRLRSGGTSRTVAVIVER